MVDRVTNLEGKVATLIGVVNKMSKMMTHRESAATNRNDHIESYIAENNYCKATLDSISKSATSMGSLTRELMDEILTENEFATCTVKGQGQTDQEGICEEKREIIEKYVKKRYRESASAPTIRTFMRQYFTKRQRT
uniref:BEN domain-containing protein n=1 Tax=Clytia hemisphaerica TaxID=252671 RepID=A0A7M6DQB6_9CNID